MRGVTLLEVMLVLLVAASIFLFTFTQIRNYQMDRDVQQLKANVDMLFQGLANYHDANCYGSLNAAFQLVPGSLNPASDRYPGETANFPIDIQKDLVNNGFIEQPVGGSLLPFNPLVARGAGINPYVTQFNQYVSDRKVCVTPAGTAPVTDPYDLEQCSQTLTTGRIILWKAQVAVLLGDPRLSQDPTLASSYLARLGGDCLSTLSPTGNMVVPCKDAIPSPTNKYVVWERLPSRANPQAQSEYWLTNQTVKQFKQQYVTYPTGAGGKIPYILCGG